MKMTKAVISAFLIGLLAVPSAWADTVCRQGAGNPNTQPWATYNVAPPSGVSSLATNTPSATTTAVGASGVACTTPGGASCTIILASTEIIGWSNVTITMRNSGANAFSNVLIEFSPDGTNWEVWDSTTLATLAAAAILSISISGNSRRYIRMEARSASGATAVVNLTMNDG